MLKDVYVNSSDIDIIIDRGNVNTYDQYFDLREELINELGTEVDLLSIDIIKPHFFKYYGALYKIRFQN
ncbi:hypothetical protein IJG04_02200 [Candidatus Saccharibacteria bacterium]|nr:hypothetical protein [Candidatus Saccharibacteria bacterium]